MKQIFKNPKYISVASKYELAEMLTEYNLGGEICYPIEDLRKEIAFRDMLGEWIDGEHTTKDNGCGHDNNENY
jgi:hypothetical protein